MWRPHHLNWQEILNKKDIAGQESVQGYQIARIGIKDTSHPTPILYIEVQYMIWILSGVGDVPTPTFWHWLCANSKCALRCMGSCRILHNTHDFLHIDYHFQIESEVHNFLFGTTAKPSFTFSNSSELACLFLLIVLYLWLWARRPTACMHQVLQQSNYQEGCCENVPSHFGRESSSQSLFVSSQGKSKALNVLLQNQCEQL